GKTVRTCKALRWTPSMPYLALRIEQTCAEYSSCQGTRCGSRATAGDAETPSLMKNSSGLSDLTTMSGLGGSLASLIYASGECSRPARGDPRLPTCTKHGRIWYGSSSRHSMKHRSVCPQACVSGRAGGQPAKLTGTDAPVRRQGKHDPLRVAE